jgi:hypothetical protein
MNKGLVGVVLRAGARAFFRRVFLSAFGAADGRPLWVVDIDNTVAHTWPSLLEPAGSDAARLAALPPLEGMCDRVREAVPRVRVVFVTVRPYAAYFATRKWLRAQGLPSGAANVVLVEEPAGKPALLEEGFHLFPWRQVEYYDDLSYHQETGSVKFYGDLIGRVRKLPLKYVGYWELRGINGENDETL